MTGLILISVFAACLIFSVFSDLVSMKIPNAVSFLIVGSFCAFGLHAGVAPLAMALHILIGATILIVTFGAFAAGWMGGGDAKLMAATAVWFGPTADLAGYLLIGSVYGGILTLALLAARGRLAPVTGIDFVDRLLHPQTGVPYGIALGVAGIQVLSDSAWIDLAIAL